VSRQLYILGGIVLQKADVIIVGSGIAALQLAYHLSLDKNVIVLTKSRVQEGNSFLAQGGIAASIGKDDNFVYHGKDTLEAGRFHNNEEVVERVTEEAPELIDELRNAGCLFDLDDNGQLLLGMEGAHSRNRIVHSGGDATGKHVMEFLISAIQRKCNVTIVENMFVYELLINEQNECFGVKAKDPSGKIHPFFADHIVMATGGCGYLYNLTSASSNVIGDGIAIAYLAGAEIADMEFIQFHPTMLAIDGVVKGLISEAVRGQGARLVTKSGAKIMEGVHPLKDLAPRHIVAQTIFDYIQNGEEIFLDITPIDRFSEKFPTITALCSENGIDLKEGKIPVVPGSHFLMGGIKVNLTGETNIRGLYAIGEVSCTGLHGANRLASNSLLEGLSFGKRLAQYLNSVKTANRQVAWENTQPKGKTKPACVANLSELRKSMMERVGIVRTRESLQMQKKWLENFYQLNRPAPNLDDMTISETASFLASVTALLITDAALTRTESRGGHFRPDYPEENSAWQKKQLVYQIDKGRIGTNEQANVAVHAGTILS
jgi:L-aspartate oxidase